MPTPDAGPSATLEAIKDRAGVVAKLGPPRPGGDLINAAHRSAADVPRLVAALEAVLKLHAPGAARKSYDLDLRCERHPPERGWVSAIMACPECSWRAYSKCAHGCEGDYPCPTVLAITRQLAGTSRMPEAGKREEAKPRLISEPAAADESWWCDCPDREGAHVHMPNWGGQGGSIALTALVDTETGLEIPGSRRGGGG